MSADNFVGVRHNKDNTYSILEYGCMSILDEDCQYLSEDGDKVQPHHPLTVLSREHALVKAHDIVNKMDICEYGVIEVTPTEVPCGTCYVCVHVRGIVADTVVKCTECEQPISTSEWQTHTNGGVFNTRCEPR